MVLAPVVRGRKGEYGKLFEELRARGLHAREGRRRAAPARGGDRARQEVQARHRGRRRPAGHAARPAQAAGRLDRDRGGAGRRASSRSSGAARRRATGAGATYSEKFACLHCGPSMPSSSRGSSRSTRRTAPARAAPGWARRWRSTPSWSCPTRRCRSARARSCRGPRARRTTTTQMTQAIAERYEVDLDTPWEELPRGAAGLLPATARTATGSTSRTATATGAGARTRRASRGSSPTSSAATARPTPSTSREKIEEYMSVRPCPECGGARLRPESLAVHGRRARRSTSSRRCRRERALEWFDAAGADRHRAPDRAADPARDRGAAAVPRQRRRRLPVDGARGGDAVGRRGAADPARDADRVVARRRALHPRRAVDRAAPARQRAADRARSSGCATSATP